MGLFLARHGSTVFNGWMRCQGSRIDLPLSARGIREAEHLRQVLAPVPLRRIFSSPLLRAVQTAEAVGRGRGLTPEPLAAFTELDMGDLSGERFEDFPREFSAFREDFSHFHPPGGESGEHLAARVMPALFSLLDSCRGEDSLLVTHLCVIRCALDGLGSPQSPGALRNGSLFYLREGPRGPVAEPFPDGGRN